VIIDLHAHTYPTPEIGRQAMQGHGRSPYAGTVPELRQAMAAGGIAAAVMVNLTPIAEMREAALRRLPAERAGAERAEAEARIRDELAGRLRRRNRWTLEAARGEQGLIPFIGLDPSVLGPAELRDELEACLAAGARGIKLHPIIQRLPPTHPALWPVYELAQELGLPVLFHSGAFGRSPWNDLARPRAFADILEAFPALPVVLAHLGHGYLDEARELAGRFPRVRFDTCGAVTSAQVPWRLDDAEVVARLRALGVERVCFGSDYPWFDPAADAAYLAGLPGLTATEREAILEGNARRLLEGDG